MEAAPTPTPAQDGIAKPKKASRRSKKKLAPIIDFDNLNPLSPEVIANQATQNIGTLGHAGHGKSTLVLAISGIRPQKHTAEQVRNITIKLGYANFKIFKCGTCPAPQCFQAGKSSLKKAKCAICQSVMVLLRHFSFVDCPGHGCLMATMLNGAAVMDAAFLTVAANQEVPQPQTAEHLAAAEITRLKNIIVVQTKVDLVEEQQLYDNYTQINDFKRETLAEMSPVIPVSSVPNKCCNIDVLLQYLVETVPIPERDLKSPFLMTVVRSFDVNKPGQDWNTLIGGVAGGSLKRGIIKLGSLVEMRPGIIMKDQDGEFTCRPLITKVTSLFSETNSLQFAIPGGLIAVGTLLDPVLTKADRLCGQVIGQVGHMPEVYREIEITFSLMRRMIGLVDSDENPGKITKLVKGEKILVNIGSSSAVAFVQAVKGSPRAAKLKLAKPCCIEIGDQITLSRSFNKSYRLIGCGTIVHGNPMQLMSSQ